MKVRPFLHGALLLTVLLVLASACGASSPPARGTALLTIVPPSITQTTNADAIDGQHVVFTPVELEAAPAQRIYVHLTSSNTTPTAADPMWGVMANAGARVIVLAHDTVDSEAPEDAHVEVPEILATLLRHLNKTAPADGWDPFLTDRQDTSIEETIAWENVIIAGHRDGADRAAALASAYPVDRAVLLSGPLAEGPPISAPVIAVNHSEDDLAAREAVWESLGLSAGEARWASPADIEQPASSMEGNRFVSELEPIDGFNPRNDWQHRRYKSLWEYVCCE